MNIKFSKLSYVLKRYVVESQHYTIHNNGRLTDEWNTENLNKGDIADQKSFDDYIRERDRL